MKTIFIACWYDEKNPQRRAELIECLKKAMAKVDRIIVIGENTDPPEGLRLYESKTLLDQTKGLNEYHRMRDRPTFQTFFDIANEYAQKGDIVIISNTDIFPEIDTVSILQGIGENDCYALARWDVQADGSKVLLDRWDTADTWVFKAPIREIKDSDFYMGKAGCDNAINARIHQAGYGISNPSRTIKFNHLHLSGVLNYNSDHKAPKPYLLITPHHLGEGAQYHFN